MDFFQGDRCLAGLIDFFYNIAVSVLGTGHWLHDRLRGVAQQASRLSRRT